MKLTPLDIRKQEFKKTMRGFDPDEVEAFLSMVADEMEHVIRERNQLNDELIKLRTQLRDYQQVEQTLRDTLLKAQNTVDESRANSKREAQIIIHEAELSGEEIIKNAKAELLNLRNETNLVRAQKESFAKRLRHLLESQIELLQVLEIDDVETEGSSPTHNLSSRQRGWLPRSSTSETPAQDQHTFEEFHKEPRIIREQNPMDHQSQLNLSKDFREDENFDEGKTEDPDTDGPLSDQIII